jgi:hypothetical protein
LNLNVSTGLAQFVTGHAPCDHPRHKDVTRFPSISTEIRSFDCVIVTCAPGGKSNPQ